MEPESSQSFRPSIADESEIASLLTSSSFPWDLSDSEDDEDLSKVFDDEASDDYEVGQNINSHLTAPIVSSRRLQTKRSTTLVLPTAARYKDALVDSWCMNEPDLPYENIYIRANMISRISLPKLISKLTQTEKLDPELLEVFFICYRHYITHLQLISSLNKRIDEMETSTSQSEKESVHKGVCALIIQWLTSYSDDFKFGGQDAVDQILLLLCGPIHKTSRSQCRVIVSLLEQIKTRSDAFSTSANMVSSLGAAPSPTYTLNDSCSFLELDPEEIARQLTLMDCYLYKLIKPIELSTFGWLKEEKDTLARHVIEMQGHASRVSQIVYLSIAIQPKNSKRAKILGRWLKVCAHLLSFGAMNSLLSVISGFSYIRYPKLSTLLEEDLSSTQRDALSRFQHLADESGNMNSYRLHMQSFTGPSCLPWLEISLSDLHHINLTYPSVTHDKCIFLRKWQLVRDGIAAFLKHQTTSSFNFQPLQPVHDFFRMLPSFDDARISMILDASKPANKQIEVDRQEFVAQVRELFHRKLEFHPPTKAQKRSK